MVSISFSGSACLMSSALKTASVGKFMAKNTPIMTAAEIPAPIPNEGGCINKIAQIRVNLVFCANRTHPS
jgi:hypothetical protein